jgi:hypothetical protein
MIKTNVKDKLIGIIQRIEDKDLLDEVMRLLDMGLEEKEYITSDEQKSAIEEAKKQYKKKKYLTDNESDRQIDEWLKE